MYLIESNHSFVNKYIITDNVYELVPNYLLIFSKDNTVKNNFYFN
jgi:hypothetical protein